MDPGFHASQEGRCLVLPIEQGQVAPYILDYVILVVELFYILEDQVEITG